MIIVIVNYKQNITSVKVQKLAKAKLKLKFPHKILVLQISIFLNLFSNVVKWRAGYTIEDVQTCHSI